MTASTTSVKSTRRNATKDMSLQERLELRGIVREQRVEGMTECHIFQGSTNDQGYSRIRFQGKVAYAHREVLAEKLGRPITEGMVAMHLCDQPSCVNEDHLREGTYAENALDCSAKGRTNKVGKTSRHATIDEWAEVQQLHEAGLSAPKISARTGISVKHIQNVVNGHHPFPKKYQRAVEIWALYNEARTVMDLAKVYAELEKLGQLHHFDDASA